MKKKKLLLIIGIVIIAVVAAVWLGAWIYFKSLLPTIDGKLACPSIKTKVTVTRDNWGVPHITAENSHDAYFALGFTIAQDRLFQMDIQRRLAKGELAEILGTELIPIDSKFRTYLFKHTGEKMIARLAKTNPEAIAIIDAYLDGVNYFIEKGPLPVEFKLLGYKPKPFTKIDPAAFFGYVNFSFTEGIVTDSLATIIKTKYPNLNIREIFPGYDRQKPVTVIEDQAFFSGNTTKTTSISLPKTIDGESGRNTAYSLVKGKDLELILNSLRELAPYWPTKMGSNAWAIGPSRSKSGKAILAGDTHMAYSNPGIWYEAHITCGDYDDYGNFMSLFPFPLLAQNKHRAWSITMFENDDLDLYAETFDPKDSSRVMYRGQWVRAEVLKETIKVKGGKDVSLEIRITPHGPIITDYLDGYEGKPIALCNVYNQIENPAIDAIYLLSRSKNLQEAEKAVSLLAAPGLNFVYADSQGNIAWWAAGRLPIRPAHVLSKQILDGSSGKDEYLGYLPFALNPKLINPPSGIIISANNLPTKKSVGPIRQIEGYWQPSDRAGRITELLSQKEKWGLDDMMKIQTDVTTDTGRDIINDISKVLGNITTPEITPVEKEALDILKSWDAVYRIESVAPSIYEFTCFHILQEAVEDEFGEKNFNSFLSVADHWNFFKAFIKDDASPLWDDVRTPQKETRRDIVLRGFKAAVADLGKNHGKSIKGWQWGNIHTIEYEHPIGMQKPMNLLFNIGPFPAPGGYEVINIFAVDKEARNYKVSNGPSTRRLIDYADLSKSYTILPTGNAGNFMSPHFDDQAQMYLKGEYRIVNFTAEQIKANKRHELVLEPSAGK
jgi:penicillin amidase